ncbi:hypothetical protein [Kordiimonas aquimaris]|uniref:hypothetical protein n=1 Tax=Kordiimonas aquimaris TaxID=707591 RepID=UPI0021D0A38A|nr:hypothetical protein [Kordiimonas aquimaris]
MAQRTKRSDDLCPLLKEKYLKAVWTARNVAIEAMTDLSPFGAEYLHMQSLLRFVDSHQERYTGNREHFQSAAPQTPTIAQHHNDA